MKTEPALLIVGSGAMACLFAYRLTRAGIRVSMLGTWKAGLEALTKDGVTVLHPDGSRERYPVAATSDPARVKGSRFALVLVKSWQTERAARQLAGCLAPDGISLTLQNGLGNREILSRALGEERVALGIATLGANLAGPGVVVPAGDGSITVGAHPRLDPLLRLLSRAGFNVECSSNPDALLWGKLAINAAINPVTALLGIPNGDLLARPTLQALSSSAAREVAAVAAARGIDLPFPDPAKAAEAVARRTSANRSSMLQDVQRGAPTEIDAISGAIVHEGEELHVPTPVNRVLWQLIKARVYGKDSP